MWINQTPLNTGGHLLDDQANIGERTPAMLLVVVALLLNDAKVIVMH
jgi:hypothetical protein